MLRVTDYIHVGSTSRASAVAVAPTAPCASSRDDPMSRGHDVAVRVRRQGIKPHSTKCSQGVPEKNAFASSRAHFGGLCVHRLRAAFSAFSHART